MTKRAPRRSQWAKMCLQQIRFTALIFILRTPPFPLSPLGPTLWGHGGFKGLFHHWPPSPVNVRQVARWGDSWRDSTSPGCRTWRHQPQLKTFFQLSKVLQHLFNFSLKQEENLVSGSGSKEVESIWSQWLPTGCPHINVTKVLEKVVLCGSEPACPGSLTTG